MNIFQILIKTLTKTKILELRHIFCIILYLMANKKVRENSNKTTQKNKDKEKEKINTDTHNKVLLVARNTISIHNKILQYHVFIFILFRI